MTVIYRFSFFIYALFLSALAMAQAPIDVLHYRYDLTLSDASDAITGTAFITVRFKSNASELSFDLASVEDDKGMMAFQVKEKGALLTSRHFDNHILITLTPQAKAGEEHTYEINYMGTPKDGLIIGQNRFGQRTFFSDNWPNRAHEWIPCIDRPDDKASFEFRVTAPSIYQVISNGVLIKDSVVDAQTRMTWWREDLPQPTKVMVIGVARFAVKQYDPSIAGIPVSAWVFPEDSSKGFYDYGVAPGIIRFFQNYIAPYPYRKLANVQSKTIFGGMENSSAIFYAEESVTGTRKWEDVVAHEIAHQWFGDMASEKSFAHLWLSEGFATYFTHLYMESKYGADSARRRWITDRKVVIDFTSKSQRTVVDSTSDLMSLLNANSYQKGGWVLRMLQKKLGDSVFQKVIRKYYSTYAGGNAETRDFIRVADSVSGLQLEPFFKQWLYRPGMPQLSFELKSDRDEAKLKIIQVGSLFEFPLEIEWSSAEGKRIQTVNVSGKETEIKIKGKGPFSFVPDPGAWLLYTR